MVVTFWGVRGSIPTPLTPAQLASRIAAVVQRVTPADLETPDSRERFLAGLPPYLMGTVGGNTTCLEVATEDKQILILDAGSGIRELGNGLKVRAPGCRTFHIFFTHFHWDHIQGLPFFGPLFDPGCTVHFYSPVPTMEKILRGQMRPPYFPITLDDARATLRFHHLEGDSLRLGKVEVSWRPMDHPGGCFAYRLEERGKSFIFATDTALSTNDFERNGENASFFGGVDLLIADSQYTLDEAIEKYDWGHTSYSLAVDFAAAWGIRKLVLFHHEPRYEDKKIFTMEKSSRWYLHHMENQAVEIFLARESLEIPVR